MLKRETPFFFAAPRLQQQMRGRDAPRSEKNGTEAALAGALFHLVAYAFAFELCLGGRAWSTQLLLAIPLAAVVLLGWLILIFANALLLRFLRRRGMLLALPPRRLQGVLIGLVLTIFAFALAQGSGWTRVVGLTWLTLAGLNLLAAAILALKR